MPSGEWDWDQYGPNVSFVADDPEEFFVGINVGPGAFKRDGARQCRLQRDCDRLRYIFDISWLQSRSAADKPRIDWKPFEQLDESRQKSVVWPKHHGRTDNERIGERGPYCQFTLPTLANIKRLRAGIGTNPRNMNQPLNAGSLRLDCHPLSGLDMNGMKGLPPVFNVKTDYLTAP